MTSRDKPLTAEIAEKPQSSQRNRTFIGLSEFLCVLMIFSAISAVKSFALSNQCDTSHVPVQRRVINLDCTTLATI